MKQHRIFALALATMVMLPLAASAQAFGGGGGGPLDGLVNWLQGSVITAVATLAIIGVGAAMFFLRFHFVSILAVCSGVWVMFNATTILGFLR